MMLRLTRREALCHYGLWILSNLSEPLFAQTA
jgi:hypothetical protein